MKTIFYALLTLCVIISITAGCGNVKMTPGTAARYTDPVPSGNVVVQGRFDGNNGQTASGDAIIYYDPSSNTYTLRLVGLSVTAENGLMIKVYGSIGLLTTVGLKGFTGNQNYPLSDVPISTSFSTISIFSTVNNMEYATALLYRSSI